MVPYMLLPKLEPIFKENGFSYTILKADQIPDEVPPVVTLAGVQLFFGICCVESQMDEDDVKAALMYVWMPSRYKRDDGEQYYPMRFSGFLIYSILLLQQK